MVTKLGWVSFWSGVKAKVASAFHSDATSLRRSVQEQTPDCQSAFERHLKIIKEATPVPAVATSILFPKPEPILGRFEGKTWKEIATMVARENLKLDIADFGWPPKLPAGHYLHLGANGELNIVPNVQECDATMPNSNSLLETKELLSSHLTNSNTTTMFKKLRDDFETLLAKIGMVSHRLLSYIMMAIAFGTNLLNIISGSTGAIEIKNLLPAGTDPALLEDFIMGVTKAIGYLTQSEAILKAATPDEMLKLFLEDLKKDAPGLQKTKIYAFVWNLAAHLDGNSKIHAVYSYLVGKYFLKTKLDAGISADTSLKAAA